jgi:hypothetical protein
VLTEVERLAARLESVPKGSIDPARLGTSLHALARRLTALAGPPDGAVTDKLHDASAEDVFDFIDNDLGVS